jgi:hypothetical protein
MNDRATASASPSARGSFEGAQFGSAEKNKCLSVFQLHFPANLPEAFSQNVALCQRSARLGMEKKPRSPAANGCFQQRSKGRRYIDFPDSAVRFRSLAGRELELARGYFPIARFEWHRKHLPHIKIASVERCGMRSGIRVANNSPDERARLTYGLRHGFLDGDIRLASGPRVEQRRPRNKHACRSGTVSGMLLCRCCR